MRFNQKGSSDESIEREIAKIDKDLKSQGSGWKSRISWWIIPLIFVAVFILYEMLRETSQGIQRDPSFIKPTETLR